MIQSMLFHDLLSIITINELTQTRGAFIFTLFENENEWQKTDPVPILLTRASRNIPVIKTINEKKYIIGLRR